MINEVLQWTVLLGTLFLLMGVLRQVALSLPSRSRAVTLSGPDIGTKMPRRIRDELQLTMNGDERRQAVVAFVTENCIGCQRLLSELSGAESHPDPLLIVANRPTGNFLQALRALELPLISDDGTVWEQAGVTATPLIVRVNEEGEVLAKGVSHHVDAVQAEAETVSSAVSA